MTPTNNQQRARWIAGEFASRLGQTLEFLAGVPVKLSWQPVEKPQTDASAFIWEQSLTLPGSPVLWVAAGDAAVCELAKRALSAAGVETPETAELRNTLSEIIAQSLSATASAIGARLRREASLQDGKNLAEVPEAAAWFAIESASPDNAFGGLWLGLSQMLLDVLEGQTAPVMETQAMVSSSVPVPAPGAAIDLLLDVELPVSISFGRAQVPLKDLIKLTTGSIVELNRTVTEPVEVIVNNCVIARGEVVVVEGNYGVRINEIVSRQERLRTLN